MLQQRGRWQSRLGLTVESEFKIWGVRHGLATFPTASIGLVVANGQDKTDEVIKQLDVTELQAKQKGKNRVESVTLASFLQEGTQP